MFNNNINEIEEKIYSDSGKIIGWIEGDAFCKNAYSSKHMLQKPKGWAWDFGVLERAIGKDLKESIIFEQEHNLIYQARLSDFQRFGVNINRGFGKQVCLPIKYWHVSRQSEVVETQLKLLF